MQERQAVSAAGRPKLVILFGPPLSGKRTLAWQLSRSLADKSAVLSVEDLAMRAFAISAADRRAELDMAHTQLRLLAANYLKNGYHLAIHGTFLYEGQDGMLDFQAEIDQLIQLMRHLAPDALMVQLSASDETLRERAAKAGREADLALTRDIASPYKGRYGLRFLELESDSQPPEGLAATIRQHLGV